MFAPKGGSQLTVGSLDAFMDQDPTYGKSVPHSLVYGNYIRFNAVVLEGKKLTASSITTLHLICNQQSSIFFRKSSNIFIKLLGRLIKPPNALNGFQNYTTDIPFGNFVLKSGQILERK